MEHAYTSYTKVIDSKTFYFVKKFMAFPELKEIDPILESFGMHAEFEKACSIAGIYDPIIKDQLYNEMANKVILAKVIDLNEATLSKKKSVGL